MFYQLVPASSSELVLCVNQGARFSKFDRRRSEPPSRAWSRRFSRATTRIERTGEYQVSLNRVLELGQRFQQDLDPAQKERWLALEDALLDHVSQLNQAYFEAGAELGRQLSEQLSEQLSKQVYEQLSEQLSRQLSKQLSKQSSGSSPKQASRLRQHARGAAHCRNAGVERGKEAEIIKALAQLICKLVER